MNSKIKTLRELVRAEIRRALNEDEALAAALSGDPGAAAKDKASRKKNLTAAIKTGEENVKRLQAQKQALLKALNSIK